MTWEPKQNEVVEVSNENWEPADERAFVTRKFVVKHNGKFYCEEDNSDRLVSWIFCRPLTPAVEEIKLFDVVGLTMTDRKNCAVVIDLNPNLDGKSYDIFWPHDGHVSQINREFVQRVTDKIAVAPAIYKAIDLSVRQVSGTLFETKQHAEKELNDRASKFIHWPSRPIDFVIVDKEA